MQIQWVGAMVCAMIDQVQLKIVDQLNRRPENLERRCNIEASEETQESPVEPMVASRGVGAFCFTIFHRACQG